MDSSISLGSVSQLTAWTLQFDFLEAIFNDPVKAFSAPQIPAHPQPLSSETKLTFGELYCYTLAGSPRATKSSKEALLGLEPGTLPGKNKAGTTAALAAKRKKEAASNGLDLTKVEQASGLVSVAGSVTGTIGDEASQAGGDEIDEVENYEGLKEGLSRVCMMVRRGQEACTNFAMMLTPRALQINVGRINTTFACESESNVALPTCHLELTMLDLICPTVSVYPVSSRESSSLDKHLLTCLATHSSSCARCYGRIIPYLLCRNHKQHEERCKVSLRTLAVERIKLTENYTSTTDAPRLKIMLKAVLLENEHSKTAPNGLNQIWEAGETGQCPATSICNLLLAFALRPEPAHEKFFSDYPSHINLLTLFTPLLIRSSERAKAFLYVIYHYLEAHGSPNPFADEGQPDKIPTLHVLSQEDYDALGENTDSSEEVQFGIEMKAQRLQCVAELAQQKEEEERVKADPDISAAADAALLRETTMWPKPKKARGPAANGKKRKRTSDGGTGDASDFLTHEQLDRDVDRHDTISESHSRRVWNAGIDESSASRSRRLGLEDGAGILRGPRYQV